MTLELPPQIFEKKKTQNTKFNDKAVHCDPGFSHADGRTDITNLTAAFRNFAKSG